MTFEAGYQLSMRPAILHTIQYNALLLSVSVAMQSYRVDVGVAQVIVGNEVLLKCDIPSFVTDFVTVSDWVDSEGIAYSPSSNLGKEIMILSKM